MLLKYEGPPIQGWMSQEELLWLFGMAAQSKNIAEIGSWKGRSTHALLSGCEGTVYAVDHFLGSASQRNDVHKEALTRDIHAEFMANVGHFQNLVVLKMDSIEASKSFGPKWFDMVFLDGDHDYEPVRADIEAWLPRCSKLLCGHDLEEGGVKRALIDLRLPFEKVGIGSLWRVNL